MTTTVTRHRRYLYARDFVLGVLIASLVVVIGAAGPAVGRTNAATTPTTTISIGDSGHAKHFVVMRKTHACEFNGRYALCKTVRSWVRRYGYVNGHTTGLIYNSGQTIHIVWRYFSGHTHWCMKCLLQVRATNYVATLPDDPTWDWDGLVSTEAPRPCAVREYHYGHSCKTAYRTHINRFINYYVMSPIPLSRTETAGVHTHVWIDTDLSIYGRAHGLRISSSVECC